MVEHGNNAAMREALERCNEFFRCDDNKPRLCHLARKADEATQAALAAPPRNCDRFGDELDAQLAFLNEEWLISVDRDSMLETDKFENWTDQMKSAYARWLMAIAKETAMEANKHDNDFDAGFHNWMASAMEADWYEKHGKPIPQELKKRRDEARDWLNGLSDDEYSSLIH